MNRYLISVVGPTAIGKTSLSIALAKHFNTEIVSSDSRQFYKEMQIGTAVPSNEELTAAPHHFIQHISIEDDYNVGTFEKDAIETLETLFKTKNVAVMVGGSGLYIKAITEGLDDFPDVDPNLREQLNKRLRTEGISSLQEDLKTLDKKSYDAIAIDNPQRLLRALEISIGTGKPYSSFLNKKQTERQFKTITIGLTAERTLIYDRINARVDQMVESGLLEEAKSLYGKKHLNALNTVGYKELFKYFDGEWTLNFSISEIKKNTRRFAKRQLTWFRKDPDIEWFDYSAPVTEITSYIESQFN